MLLFPNCKINLGLHILNKREDGFHNIQTVFYPINLTDGIEIIATQNALAKNTFTTSGLNIAINEADNICIKALQLIKKDFPNLPNIKMHLHKSIPMGAGLGGGSADGAFTLHLLNKKFNLNLSNTQLLNYALQLGSDCPFFIINKPCFATGRGEIFEAINLNLSAYKIVLVHPNIHVNTTWAFSQLVLSKPKKSIHQIIKQPISTWKEDLKNDFEKPVFEKYPVIKKIKEDLYAQDAIYASMSGSGSTVYAIFEKEIATQICISKNYFVKTINL